MGYALITGASAGLGVDFAKLFAQDGHSVVLVARREDRLHEVAKELEANHPGVKALVIAADLGIPGAGKKLFQQVQDKGLHIDFLVNNAGFGSNGDFAKLPLDKELQMIDLNIRSLVELTHLFMQSMLTKKFGRILNVGSTAGFQPGPYMTTYYATKAFVNSFSEALNQELQGSGVSCTILAPGPTQTEFAGVANMNSTALFKKGIIATSVKVAQDGYRAMHRGDSMMISGVANKLLVQSLRFSPRNLITKVVSKLNRSAKT